MSVLKASGLSGLGSRVSVLSCFSSFGPGLRASAWKVSGFGASSWVSGAGCRGFRKKGPAPFVRFRALLLPEGSGVRYVMV